MSRPETVSLVGIAGSCKGTVCRARTPTITIGSAKKSDFVVTGRLVSEVHATVEIGTDGRVTLRNRSPHGTFVNRDAVDVRQLQRGDRIQIGEGGIVEVQIGEDAVKREGAKAKSGKKPILMVVVVVYLLAMVALMGYLATRPKGPAAVSGDAVAAALAKTRSELLDKSWWIDQGHSTTPQVISDLDPSGAYYAVQSLIASDAPPEQVAAKADLLLQRLQGMFQDARMLEQRERWKDARARYHQIIEAVPDSRLAITQLADARLAKLERLGGNGK
jgi:hypothetical protein